MPEDRDGTGKFEDAASLLSFGSADHAEDERRRSFPHRKTHTKSRDGCFTCKRRKVKVWRRMPEMIVWSCLLLSQCPENRPHCTPCIARGLFCEYPARFRSTLVKSWKTTPLPTIQSPAVQPLLSVRDLRLFHHYMLVAHPHLPVGNDMVWVERVPLLAYQVSFHRHARRSKMTPKVPVPHACNPCLERVKLSNVRSWRLHICSAPPSCCCSQWPESTFLQAREVSKSGRRFFGIFLCSWISGHAHGRRPDRFLNHDQRLPCCHQTDPFRQAWYRL